MNRDDAMRRSRRCVVLGGAGLAVAGFPWLTACANRPKPPPKPVSLLAVLPVSMAAGGNAGSGSPSIPYAPPMRPPGASVGAALAGGIIGSALVLAIESKRRQDRAALQQAMAKVDFDPVSAVQQRIEGALGQRDVRATLIADPALAAAIRAGQVDGLAPEVDAILDISVEEYGYYSSTRAGGFSPILNLSAVVRGAKAGAEELDGFTYYADWRDGGKDTRWVMTPKSVTYASEIELSQHGSEARAVFEEVTEKLVAMMASDVRRHVQGLARID